MTVPIFLTRNGEATCISCEHSVTGQYVGIYDDGPMKMRKIITLCLHCATKLAEATQRGLTSSAQWDKIESC